MKLTKITKYFKDPLTIVLRELCKHPSLFNDEQYVRIKYRFRMGRRLNLDNPQTYNEKLQWLKLYNHNPQYTQYVDKVKVKALITKAIGGGYVVPTIAVWDTVEDIDWQQLPNSFVIKCNHDSGGLVICKNKEDLDIELAKKKLKWSLEHDNYSVTREWPYKNVKRRLICEEYLEDSETNELRDYKFFCFDGVPRVMMIASDRAKKNIETKLDFFDMDFNHMPLVRTHPNSSTPLKKPVCFEEMKTIASKLSQGFPHVRVDLYEVNGKVYFGELTFFTGGGFGKFTPDIWDYKFGEWIKLPESKLI